MVDVTAGPEAGLGAKGGGVPVLPFSGAWRVGSINGTKDDEEELAECQSKKPALCALLVVVVEEGLALWRTGADGKITEQIFLTPARKPAEHTTPVPCFPSRLGTLIAPVPFRPVLKSLR